MSVSILKVGFGNHASIARMVAKVGGEAKYVSGPDEILNAKKLIIPGVGHFAEGIRQINNCNLTQSLIEAANVHKTPILGICLGMQLLCERSEESDLPGLGLVSASVKKFRPNQGVSLKVPHMGWKEIKVKRKNKIFDNDTHPKRFYFVHSYYVEVKNQDIVIGTANHGLEFCAAFQYKNLFGVQFHPEKSHRFGMALMKNFIEA